MRKKSRPYKIGLRERLQDPAHAANYINATLEENTNEALRTALRDVAEVTQGMSGLAESASVNRENLYRMLSEHGNPRLENLRSVLLAMNLRLLVAPLTKQDLDDPEQENSSRVEDTQITVVQGLERIVIETMPSTFTTGTFADAAKFVVGGQRVPIYGKSAPESSGTLRRGNIGRNKALVSQLAIPPSAYVGSKLEPQNVEYLT